MAAINCTLNNVQGFMDESYSWSLRCGLDPVSVTFPCQRSDAIQLLGNPFNATLRISAGEVSAGATTLTMGPSLPYIGKTLEIQGLYIGEVPPDRQRYEKAFSVGDVEILDCRYHLTFGTIGKRDFNWKTKDFRRSRTGEYQEFYYRIDTLNRYHCAWNVGQIIDWIEEAWTGGGGHSDYFQSKRWDVKLSVITAAIVVSDLTLSGSPAQALNQLFNLPELAGVVTSWVDTLGVFHISDQPPILESAIQPEGAVSATVGKINKITKKPHEVRVLFPKIRRQVIRTWETVIPSDEDFTRNGISYAVGQWVRLPDLAPQWFQSPDGGKIGHIRGTGTSEDPYTTPQYVGLSDSEITNLIRTHLISSPNVLQTYLRVGAGMADAGGSPATRPDLERLASLRLKLLQQHAWRTFRPYRLTISETWFGQAGRQIFANGKYYIKNKSGFGYINYDDDLKVERVDFDAYNLSGWIDAKIQLVDPENLVITITGEPEQIFQHTLIKTGTSRHVAGNLKFEGYLSLWVTLYIYVQPNAPEDMYDVLVYTVPGAGNSNGVEYIVSTTEAVFANPPPELDSKNYSLAPKSADEASRLGELMNAWSRASAIFNTLVNPAEVGAILEAEKLKAEMRWRDQWSGSLVWPGLKLLDEVQGQMGQIQELTWTVSDAQGTTTTVRYREMQPENIFFRTNRKMWDLHRQIWNEAHKGANF